MQHYMHFPMVCESSFKSSSLNQDFGVHGCLCKKTKFFWAFGFRVFRTIWIAFCFSWVIKGCVYHMLHWRHEEFMQRLP